MPHAAVASSKGPAASISRFTRCTVPVPTLRSRNCGSSVWFIFALACSLNVVRFRIEVELDIPRGDQPLGLGRNSKAKSSVLISLAPFLWLRSTVSRVPSATAELTYYNGVRRPTRISSLD